MQRVIPTYDLPRDRKLLVLFSTYQFSAKTVIMCMLWGGGVIDMKWLISRI